MNNVAFWLLMVGLAAYFVARWWRASARMTDDLADLNAEVDAGRLPCELCERPAVPLALYFHNGPVWFCAEHRLRVTSWSEPYPYNQEGI